jgi:hypothetical protein
MIQESMATFGYACRLLPKGEWLREQFADRRNRMYQHRAQEERF